MNEFFECLIPAELVDGEVTLCAGVKFQRLDDDRVELVLLTEADVDSLTSPAAADDLVGPGSRFTGHKPHGDDRG